MTLGIRKLIVLGVVAAVFLLANFLLVAGWLQENGVIDWARSIRKEYLTGTAITIILVLLVLLAQRHAGNGRMTRRCPVCDHRLPAASRYCSDCGSRA